MRRHQRRISGQLESSPALLPRGNQPRVQSPRCRGFQPALRKLRISLGPVQTHQRLSLVSWTSLHIMLRRPANSSIARPTLSISLDARQSMSANGSNMLSRYRGKALLTSLPQWSFSKAPLGSHLPARDNTCLGCIPERDPSQRNL